MKCPYCGFSESRVIDSRPTDEGERIRRRRECMKCAKRFTTYEVIENVPIVVIKKDKSRETFDRSKLLNGLLRACEKAQGHDGVIKGDIHPKGFHAEAGFQQIV